MSICVSIHLCLFALSHLNRLTYDLELLRRGRRSNENKSCFAISFVFFWSGSKSNFRIKVQVKVRGQKLRSGLTVDAQRSILGSRLAECSKGNYRQVWSEEWLLPVRESCVCVCNQGAEADTEKNRPGRAK